MRIKILCLLFGLFFSFSLFSQNQDAHINLSIFIDDEFIVGGIYNGHFLFKDTLNMRIDTIAFNYYAGDVTMTHEDYTKVLLMKKNNSRIVIQFKYRQICPENHDYEYEKEWKKPMFNYQYVIFKIYNYSNKANFDTFWQRTGYGIEVRTPAYGTVLARKNTRKNRKKKTCD